MGSIYIWENMTTGEVYVGQTKRDSDKRRREHIKQFKYAVSAGKNLCKLYSAMLEFSLDSFKFYVLQDNVLDEDLNTLEKHYIAEFDSLRDGYNGTKGGSSWAPPSVASRKLRSENAKLFWGDPSNRERILASRAGCGEHHKSRMRELWADEDYRAKVMESRSKTYATDEHKAKAAKATADKWKDPDFREKILRRQAEGRNTEEFRKKRSDISKAIWGKIKHPSCKRVVVRGIEYRSKKMAQQELGVGWRTLAKMLASGEAKIVDTSV